MKRLYLSKTKTYRIDYIHSVNYDYQYDNAPMYSNYNYDYFIL